MFHRFEILYCFADTRSLATHEQAHANGGQCVFPVVGALERDFRSQHDLALLCLVAKQHPTLANVCALFDFCVPAEPEKLCPRAAGECHAGGIVGV